MPNDDTYRGPERRRGYPSGDPTSLGVQRRSTYATGLVELAQRLEMRHN